MGALLALGCDVALQVLGRSSESSCSGARLFWALRAGKSEHLGALLLEGEELFGDLVRRLVTHARHQRGDLAVAVPVCACIALECSVVRGKRCRCRQPALLLESGFQVVREQDGLQGFLADPTDRLLRPAGELDGGGGQQIDHGQGQGDGAIELGGDLRPRQTQSVEHWIPTRRPRFAPNPSAHWRWGGLRMRDGDGARLGSAGSSVLSELPPVSSPPRATSAPSARAHRPARQAYAIGA